MSYQSLTSYNTSDSLVCGSTYETECELILTNGYSTITCDACYFNRVDASSGSDLYCPSDYPNCLINCNGQNACTNSKLHCISASGQCSNCMINCAANTACQNIQVFSYDCRFVDIYALGEVAVTDSTIFAPNGGGQLYILASNEFENTYTRDDPVFFSNNKIYGNNSNATYLECIGVTCSSNTFLLETSLRFEFYCLYGGNCTGNIFYCPKNEADNGAACYIMYDRGIASSNEYYALDGMPAV